MTAVPLTGLVARTAFADPASAKRPGELKRVKSRAAVVVVGTDGYHIFALHAWAARTSTTALLEQLFTAHDLYHPKPFGIEANAMQSLFVDCAALIAAQFGGTTVPFVPVTQPTNQTKEFRTRTTLQPILTQHRLFVHPDLTELIAELRVFPRSPQMDLVDALASAIRLLPAQATAAARRTERDDLLAYLRETHTDPREIAARLREFDHVR